MGKNIGIGFLVLLVIFILSFSTTYALSYSSKKEGEEEGEKTEEANKTENKAENGEIKTDDNTLGDVLNEVIRDVKNHPAINGSQWLLIKASPDSINVGIGGSELSIDYNRNGLKAGNHILELFFELLGAAFKEKSGLIIVSPESQETPTTDKMLQFETIKQVLSDTIQNSGFVLGFLDESIKETDDRFLPTIQFK